MQHGAPDRLARYAEVRVLHLEPTSRCQAACPMCGRNQDGGKLRDGLTLEEISAAQFRDWFPADFLAQLDRVFLCGNFGEPILARDCLEILAHCRAASAGLKLGLNTNGSARGPEFWQALARLGVRVTFGIDGATDASHRRYRRGTDLDRILANAVTFIKAGGQAVWDFIVFRHNEHEVAQARALAGTLGFAEFRVKPTARFGAPWFDVRDESGAVVDRLEPSLGHHEPPGAPRRPDIRARRIDCDVARQRSVYVSAGGMVFPCCFLGQRLIELPAPDRPEGPPESRQAEILSFAVVLDRIGARNLDLRSTDLRTILDLHLPAFERHWHAGAGRLLTCAKICGTHELCS